MPETSPEPTPTGGHDYVPTEADLKELTEFIWERTREESGRAGELKYYRDQLGLELTPQFPPTSQALKNTRLTGEQKARQWAQEHPPERFVAMAHAVFNLTLALADRARVAMSQSNLGYEYVVRHCWEEMTRAAGLWKDHPDFNPSWAEAEEYAETV